MNREALDRSFGQALVRLGLVAPAQVERALMERAPAWTAAGRDLPGMGEILIGNGSVPPEQAARVLMLQVRPPGICAACGCAVYDDPVLSRGCPDCGAMSLEGVASAPSAGLGAQATVVLPLADDGAPPESVGATVSDGATRLAPGVVARATDSLPREGTLLRRYLLVRLLGRGGMGVVWKAWDPELKRFVALKQMLPRGAASTESRARFLREARLSARLRHPHIVSVYDAGEVYGVPFLTMELIEGCTLAEQLAADRAAECTGSLSTDAGLRAHIARLADVAAAVEHAHRAGVLHRDLKPANVLVAPASSPAGSDTVFVTDFGLAREVEGAADAGAAGPRITLSGQALGTPAYMSPEQITGVAANIDRRADVWSLGVMLYEILTGRTPFVGENVWALLTCALRDAPVPPRKVGAHIPEALEAVCLQALEKDPAHRTPTAEAFEADLRRWLRGEPVRAQARSGLVHVWRWGAHRRAVVASIAAALLLVGMALAWGGWARVKRAQRAEATLSQVAAAVATMEDELMRTPVHGDARRALAEQPLGQLTRLLADLPECAAAYAWRGEVEALLGDGVAAERDFDRACALAPGDPVARILRGRYRAAKYAHLRELPGSMTTGTRVDLEPGTAETVALRDLRTAALADLSATEHAEGIAGGLGEQDRRIGSALQAVYQGGTAQLEQALALLHGIEHPRAWRVAGLACYQLGRWAEAVAEFDRVLVRWPEDAVSWRWRAIVRAPLAGALQAAGQDPSEVHRRCIADYEEAIRRDATDLRSRYNRALEWFQLGVAEGQKAEPPRAMLLQAIAELDRIEREGVDIAELPNSRGAIHFALAEWDIAAGRDPRPAFAKAIAEFDRVLVAHPEARTALHDRGLAWQRLGVWLQAEGLESEDALRRADVDLTAALQREPDNVEARVGRATTRWHLALSEAAGGQDPTAALSEAIQEFDAALATGTRLPGARLLRAHAFRALADAAVRARRDPHAPMQAAWTAFDEAVRAEPGNAEAVHGRAATVFELALLDARAGADAQARFAAAIADFDTALLLIPGVPEWLHNRGIAHYRWAQVRAATGGDSEPEFLAAERDFLAARGQDYAPSYQAVALVRHTMCRFVEAIRDYESALERLPEQAGGLKQRLAEVRADAAATPERWRAHLDIARQAAQTGDAVGARAHLAGALQCWSDLRDCLPVDVRSTYPQADPERLALAQGHYLGARLESLAARDLVTSSDPRTPVAAAVRRIRVDRALFHLLRAAELGCPELSRAQEEPDLALLRADPRFPAVLGGRPK